MGIPCENLKGKKPAGMEVKMGESSWYLHIAMSKTVIVGLP